MPKSRRFPSSHSIIALLAMAAAAPCTTAEKAAKVAARPSETSNSREAPHGKSGKQHIILNRDEILKSDPETLARIGRHIIVGYHSLSDIKRLLEKKAIGGIFITDHNVRGRNAAAMKSTIDSLQAIRKEQGLPALIIAADQEGGAVSRLSPPLKRQPSLAQVVAKASNDEERKKAVEDYAQIQAAELKRIGVTQFCARCRSQIEPEEPQRRGNASQASRHRFRPLSRFESRRLVLRRARGIKHHVYAEALPRPRPGHPRHSRRHS
jgi:Glycosyl hydrolase family 3 N terminal domain